MVSYVESPAQIEDLGQVAIRKWTSDACRRGDNASMLTDPAVLIADFSAAAGALSMDGWPCTLHGELLSAPHRQAALRPSFGAVYAFALSARTTSAARAGMVLKVG
jgi:hypothetical protein